LRSVSIGCIRLCAALGAAAAVVLVIAFLPTPDLAQVLTCARTLPYAASCLP